MKARLWILLVVVALATILSLAGCSALTGNAGNVFGQLWWSSSYTCYTTGLDNTGGFPSTVTKNDYYQIQPGSYYFSYLLYYSSSISYGYYSVSYTVTANSGSLFFKNGTDKYFTIDLYTNGPSISGLSFAEKPGSSSVSPEGVSTKTYASDDLTITLSYQKIDGDIPCPDAKVIQ
jgi:hypothetical protein